MEAVWEFDIQLLRLLNYNRIELFDNLLYWLSKTAYFVTFGIILYICLIAFFKRSEKLKTSLIRMVFMLATVSIIVISLKYAIIRARPFDIYTDIINSSGATSPSFPSGHTVIVFTLAFGLIFSGIKRLYYLPVLVWAIIVGYSRLALGAHFPTDVLTSIVIAFAVTLLFL